MAAIGRRAARRLAVVPRKYTWPSISPARSALWPPSNLGAFELEGPRDWPSLAKTDATAHLADRVFATLSGEKQRVVIASALAQQAGVLLLDEPWRRSISNY